MRGVLTERQDVEARVAEVRRELADEHEHLTNGLEKLKRRLERHLKKIDESPLKRPPSTIDAVAALLDCALDKYDELLEQRPHTPDVEFDDGDAESIGTESFASSSSSDGSMDCAVNASWERPASLAARSHSPILVT